MGIFNLSFGRKKEEEVQSVEEYDIRADYGYNYTPIYRVRYTGEKNPGEIGVVKKYRPDFTVLRERSWQSYYENEITQVVVGKYIKWVIGKGLRVNAEPVKRILDQNGISLDDEFSRDVETLFGLHAKNTTLDYASQNSLNKIANTVEKNAIISGDCLVILRVTNSGGIKIQVVDGEFVTGGGIPNLTLTQIKNRKNYFRDGVEFDKRGNHIAYYMIDVEGKFKRVPARDRAGRKRAYLVYGSKYRLSHMRGMPWISVVMETMKKLDRYKEAAVGSAEERAKVPYIFEHENGAIGINPLKQTVSGSLTGSTQTAPSDGSYDLAAKIGSNITLTEGKTVLNMPPGAKAKAIESDNDIKFAEFYLTNVNMICAALGMPPEVALSKYDSNFSASRAALKDWENTLNVARADFSEQFYQPIYDLWLDMQVATGNINAPGYMDAILSKDENVLMAYRNARFRGASVPHIDPLKEVKAEREKLGSEGAGVPLTTAEESIESLGGGDYDAIVNKFKEEVSKIEDLTNNSDGGNGVD